MRGSKNIRRIRQDPVNQTAVSASWTIQPNTIESNALASDLELRNRETARSQQILEAVRHLDMTHDDAYRQELINWLQQAYNERMGGILVGIFGRCYLGSPYIDHRMSITGQIIEHYTHEQTPPEPYARARPLVLSGKYEFVEIYSDGQVIPIRSDGTPN